MFVDVALGILIPVSDVDLIDNRDSFLQQGGFRNDELGVAHEVRIVSLVSVRQVLDERKNYFLNVLKHGLCVQILPLRPSTVIMTFKEGFVFLLPSCPPLRVNDVE